MKATGLIGKLSAKLLGKKTAAGSMTTMPPLAPDTKTPEITCRVLDGLGVIRLHKSWRN